MLLKQGNPIVVWCGAWETRYAVLKIEPHPEDDSISGIPSLSGRSFIPIFLSFDCIPVYTVSRLFTAGSREGLRKWDSIIYILLVAIRFLAQQSESMGRGCRDINMV